MKYVKEFSKGFIPYYGEHTLNKNIEKNKEAKVLEIVNGTARTALAIGSLFSPILFIGYITTSSILGYWIAKDKNSLESKVNNEVPI